MAKRKFTAPKTCCSCYKLISKDEKGICLKMLGKDTKEFYCIECLAAFWDVEVQDLLDKIEEFKEEGCTLFG